MGPQGKFTGFSGSLEQFLCPLNTDLSCWVSCSSASLQAGEAQVSITHGDLFSPFSFFFFLLHALEVLVERVKSVFSPTEPARNLHLYQVPAERGLQAFYVHEKRMRGFLSVKTHL